VSEIVNFDRNPQELSIENSLQSTYRDTDNYNYLTIQGDRSPFRPPFFRLKEIEGLDLDVNIQQEECYPNFVQ
jgi:hypothetical protein